MVKTAFIKIGIFGGEHELIKKHLFLLKDWKKEGKLKGVQDAREAMINRVCAHSAFSHY